jgi:chemotaxis protein MotB
MKKILLNLSVITVFAFCLLLYSCVPQNKFAAEQAKRKNFEQQNIDLKAKNQELTAANKELGVKIDGLVKTIKSLNKDTANLGSALRKMQQQYGNIDRLNVEIQDKYEKQKKWNMEDTEKLMKELQATKEDLQKREMALTKMESDMKDKEKNLNDLTAQLKENEKDLQEKQQRVNELQYVLNRKDSIVKALKNKVSDALLGFENKGLTIQQKNGKVYVSMEEALLFASGSFTVNKRGVEALKKLAGVLVANPDINVLVEGHTDNVPYKGVGQLKDNWDLSVMRATTIVKILVESSKVDPKRLTAAGESEYSPVDINSSPEGRAKNRRTEIILTPKLDELFKIIETN